MSERPDLLRGFTDALRAAFPEIDAAGIRMVFTDCCGQLLPESQTLVGDVHFSDRCPACSRLDGRKHDRHVTCDWSQGIECPGRDWSYDPETKRPIPPGSTEEPT